MARAGDLKALFEQFSDGDQAGRETHLKNYVHGQR